ncbi:MAG: helix-turn-helix transcriptional regulator [Succinivibrio sp.]
MKKQIVLSSNAESALQKLGSNIKKARIRRGITATNMAKLMDTTRMTLASIEDGLPSVSMGHYVKALSILGIDVSYISGLAEQIDTIE